VPVGGTTSQVLTKTSAADYATNWQTPAAGLTIPLSQNLTFSPDNAFDIGASGASRPRSLFLGGAATVGTTLTVAGNSTLRSLLFFGDNTYDIGASGNNRARDLYLGRNLAVGGTSALTGNVAVGGSPLGNAALSVAGTSFNASTQYGIDSETTFSSLATGQGYAVFGRVLTQAAAFTMGQGNALYGAAPIIGAGSTIAAMSGLRVENMGKSGVNNAYGVYIAAQSGASALNIGLYNAGTSQFDGAITLGTNATPPRIRSTPSQGEALSLESQIGALYASGKTAVGISGNAYWDGPSATWLRYDTSKAASLLFSSDLGIYMYGAPAGANPAGFTQYFFLGTNGTLVLPNSSITTPMLAGNSVQQLIGQYANTPTWSSNTSGYQETAIQTPTVACSGAMVRVEATVSFFHTATGAGMQFAFFVDGTMWSNTLAVVNQPVGGQVMVVTLIFYATPGAGNHRFAVAVNNLNAGTFNLYTGTLQTMWVTEQKR